MVLPALVQCFHDALRRFGTIELSGLQVTAYGLDLGARSPADHLVSGLNWFNLTPEGRADAFIAFDQELLGGHTEAELVASLRRRNTGSFEFGPVAAGPEQHAIQTSIDERIHSFFSRALGPWFAGYAAGVDSERRGVGSRNRHRQSARHRAGRPQLRSSSDEGSMTARSPVRTTRPIRYSLLWYSLAVSTKLTPMVERASDLRTGGSQRLRGIAWLNPKSKSPSEKFAVRYTLAHHLGQNQEPSFDGLNRHGKLRYSWGGRFGSIQDC